MPPAATAANVRAGIVLTAVAGVGALSIDMFLLQAMGAGSGPVVARAIVRDLYERERAARMLPAMGTAHALTHTLVPEGGGWVHASPARRTRNEGRVLVKRSKPRRRGCCSFLAPPPE